MKYDVPIATKDYSRITALLQTAKEALQALKAQQSPIADKLDRSISEVQKVHFTRRMTEHRR